MKKEIDKQRLDEIASKRAKKKSPYRHQRAIKQKRANAVRVLERAVKPIQEDPVHFISFDQRWYFWDETWTKKFGPFATEKLARIAMKEYAVSLGLPKLGPTADRLLAEIDSEGRSLSQVEWKEFLTLLHGEVLLRLAAVTDELKRAERQVQAGAALRRTK